MDDKTKAAVQAYFRLDQALNAVLADSQRGRRPSDWIEPLAREARKTFRDAGLTGASYPQIVSLVRQIHSRFHMEH